MNKWLRLLTMLALALTLTACGGDDNNEENNDANAAVDAAYMADADALPAVEQGAWVIQSSGAVEVDVMGDSSGQLSFGSFRSIALSMFSSEDDSVELAFDFSAAEGETGTFSTKWASFKVGDVEYVSGRDPDGEMDFGGAPLRVNIEVNTEDRLAGTVYGALSKTRDGEASEEVVVLARFDI